MGYDTVSIGRLLPIPLHAVNFISSQKILVFQRVTNYPACCGFNVFITVNTTAFNLSQFYEVETNIITSMFIITRLYQGLPYNGFPSSFQTKLFHTIHISPHPVQNYYYYYLLQLSFHSVAVVLTLVTNKNKYA